MANKSGLEIERKWKLDSRLMVKLYQQTRTWDVHHITQWYLASGALGEYLDFLSEEPNPPILYVPQEPQAWTKALPAWAYEVGIAMLPGAVRLRTVDDDRGGDTKYVLTIKGKGSIERLEFEEPLPKEVFELLLQLAWQGEPVIKRRLSFTPTDGHTLELDIFEERHEGLVLMEVEFPNREKADQYKLATTWDYFNPIEVTEDKRYDNLSLAVNGLPPD